MHSLNWVDPNRIGIVGGSFGGYATLLAITKLAHFNWKVAVDMCGPSNLITFTTNVPKIRKRISKIINVPTTTPPYLIVLKLSP